MTADRLTATAAPALAADNSEWILFITDLSDTTTDGTELGVWWATPGATDADKDLIVYTPVNGDPSSFAASWVPQGIMQLDGDTLTGVLVDVVYSDSVATVADLVGTEVDDGATAFATSFDDGLIGLPVSSLTAELAALEGRTVAGVPFTADDVPVAALAAALSLETVGGTVDAVLYDLTGESPGAVTLDLTGHPVDKAGASVLMPVGSGQTLVVTPPDPASHGHIDLDVTVDGSVTVSIPDWPVEVASVVVDGAGVVLASLAPVALADDSSAYSLVPSGTSASGGGGGSFPVDSEFYDLSGGSPGAHTLDLSGHDPSKASIIVLLPYSTDPQTLDITDSPDGPSNGHIDVWVTVNLPDPDMDDRGAVTVTADVAGDGGLAAAADVKFALAPVLDAMYVAQYRLPGDGGGGVSANSPITGATKTKITYDSKGLVTAGADATTADIPDDTDARYVTDAELVVLGNTSGTNTGDATATTEGALIHGATGKTTPVDADEIGLVDSAASNILKKLTWANLKSTLKTYTDTLYDAIGAAAAAVAAHVAASDPHGDRAYAASLFAANDALVYKGAIDCSANPNYPAADAGHAYKVSVAGKIGGGSGPNVEVGDLLVCTVDSSASGTHGTVGANWDIIQVNIDGAVTGPTSAVSGKVATFSGTSGRLIQDSGVTLGGAASLAVGTTAGTVAAGDDSRLTDTRTPTDNSVTSAKIVDGTIVNADMANMANKTYRGRHTAGSGVPEDVSVANVMADLSGAAAADFDFNSHKVTNVTADTASTSAAVVGQVPYVKTAITSTTTISNDATEQNAVSIALPTDLAAGDMVHLVAFGDRRNNSGSPVTYTHKVKLGSTTVLTQSSSQSFPSSAARSAWVFEAWVVVETTSAQRLAATYTGTLQNSNAFDAANAGASYLGSATVAEDLTSAKSLIFTVQMGTADANADFAVIGGALEIVKKR